jgi:nicotinamidase-related amidase
MHHDGFNKAVRATGRKKLIVAGVTTEICITFPVLQMLEEGYEVQVSDHASASWSKLGNDLALHRRPQCVNPTNHLMPWNTWQSHSLRSDKRCLRSPKVA